MGRKESNQTNNAPGAKNGLPRGHMFYIVIVRNMKKSSCLKPQSLDPDIWNEASPSELYQVCSKYIPGAKNGTPRVSHISQRPIYGKLEKICLS